MGLWPSYSQAMLGIRMVSRARQFMREQPPHFVHLMWNEKFVGPYVAMISEHCRAWGQMVVVAGTRAEMKFATPELPNVFAAEQLGKFGFRGLLDCCTRGQSTIVVHGLWGGRVCRYLHDHADVARRCYWTVWGGDMYPDGKSPGAESFKGKRSLIPQFAGILTLTPGDYAVAQELYGIRGFNQLVAYPTPLRTDMIIRPAAAPAGPLQIQINNSCDASTTEVLECLAPHAGQSLQIRLIHSYGDLTCRDEVERRGRALFGDKLVVQREFVSPERYGQTMAQTDILIMSQPRQQGLGNIWAAMYAGAKIYLRSDISSWKYIHGEVGATVFDTLRLREQAWESLRKVAPEIREQNRRIAAQFFDEAYLAGMWNRFFAACEGGHPQT